MEKKSYNEEFIERLPDSELIIMKVIWDSSEPVGIGKIIEVIAKEKDWTRSTVQVLLSRLEERGFIKAQKKGRLKYYTPLIDEDLYCKKETKTFLEHFYNNSYKKLIASLVEDNNIGEGDIEDIIQILKRGGDRNE
ncbi:putative transcriptional regulator [Mobilisporobacter senegalensis]|uniref:Putative transcriptional regulator n=1 Tax=Mobilisporobacter senegalensis TaxID=1329262 RepID=A0A3N1X7Z9_9FIRM|nr:BlaI/MecI/CopY family transcriptional regulator [Mobilisporobacter senegalensis]ROR22108.1 putative transcriptional regulator [Mobilisporobacter senegalensis]